MYFTTTFKKPTYQNNINNMPHPQDFHPLGYYHMLREESNLFIHSLSNIMCPHMV